MKSTDRSDERLAFTHLGSDGLGSLIKIDKTFRGDDVEVSIVGKVGCHPEITQQDSAVVVDEEIGSLDVAVDEAVDVQVTGIGHELATMGTHSQHDGPRT